MAEDRERPTNEASTTTEERAPERERERRATPKEDRTPFTQQVGRTIMAVVAILFGVFAAANIQAVDFNWLPGVDAPDVSLIVLLLISFATGAFIAWLATMRYERRR